MKKNDFKLLMDFIDYLKKTELPYINVKYGELSIELHKENVNIQQKYISENEDKFLDDYKEPTEEQLRFFTSG